MAKKICFMVMPFSRKSTGLRPGEGPAEINFDSLWESAFLPALEALGYAAVRADADTGTLIIKSMIERLAYADLVMADITIPNANVYYEVGVRQALRKQGCILVSADWAKPLFDITQMRRITYKMQDGQVGKVSSEEIIEVIKKSLPDMVDKPSPVHETVPAANNELDEQCADIEAAKDALKDPERVRQFREEMDELYGLLVEMRMIRTMSTGEQEKERSRRAEKLRDEVENQGTVQDAVRLEIMRLMRDCVGWQETLDYIDGMPASLRLMPHVQEQKLLSLSHVKGDLEAIPHLQMLIEQYGPSSERYGLLGGRYKRLYRKEEKTVGSKKVDLYLDKAIEAYYEGMLRDMNDYFPTCNLFQLLNARGNEGDAELAGLAAGITLRACERARRLEREDEWLKPTLLGAAFDSQDIVEAERLASVIENEDPLEWKLASTLEDLKQRAGFVNDEEKKKRFAMVVETLAALIQ